MRELTKRHLCNPVHRAPKLHGALLPCALLVCVGALAFPGLSPSAVASPPQALPLPDPYPSTYKPLPRTDTLIDNATVFDGIGHRLLQAGVLLHDGKIVAVGPNLQAHQGTKTID